MPLSTLHADHIGAGGAFEPQRQNNGLLFISGLAGADAIRLSIASFPVPKRSMGIIELGYLNEKRKFPGLPTYDDLTVVFNDYIDQQTAKVLWDWAFLVHNPYTGKTGLAASYKKTGWVSLYGPDGVAERQYDIIGMWPSAIDPGEVDMMAEDTVKITLTLTIDKMRPATPFKKS